MKRLSILMVAGILLVASWSVRADVIISTFDSATLDFNYASWSTGTIISGPSALTVQASGFGGGGIFINSLDASGETMIALDVTVNADTAPVILAVLEDGDGTQYNYRWFSVPAGNQVLMFPLFPVPSSNPGVADSFVGNAGSTAGLDLSDLDFYNIQIDDSDAYDVSFNNLAVVPEPASLALMLGGAGVLTLLRRRRA